MNMYVGWGEVGNEGGWREGQTCEPAKMTANQPELISLQQRQYSMTATLKQQSQWKKCMKVEIEKKLVTKKAKTCLNANHWFNELDTRDSDLGKSVVRDLTSNTKRNTDSWV